jgi:endonuclease YncB( thermonuclease family)
MPAPAPRLLLYAALAAGLVVSACQRKVEPPLNPAPPPTVADRVRVLDADTLIIDGRHTELSNASTPESVLHARCWAEALAGERADDFVRDLIAHARSIAFTPTGEIDIYNRAVGAVSVDGADLGDLLYEKGLAARVVKPRFDWCQPISKKADGAPQVSSLISFAH